MRAQFDLSSPPTKSSIRVQIMRESIGDILSESHGVDMNCEE